MPRSRINFTRQEAIEEPVVNLTPLIDVVFVILIMFIVIAPLLELDHIELAGSSQAPISNTQSVQETSPVSIHVYGDNTIAFNGESLAVSELSGRLRDAKLRFPGVVPQVFHDKRAHFGTYQSVKNAAEEAGYAQIDIILKPA